MDWVENRWIYDAENTGNTLAFIGAVSGMTSRWYG